MVSQVYVKGVSNLSQGVIKKSEGLYADNDNVVKLRSQAKKKRREQQHLQLPKN